MAINIDRKTHVIDAKGRPLGRLATEVAMILRGKNKPEFYPHLDCGDMVDIRNIKEVKLSGKKIEQKEYHHYSGYPSGLKTKKLSAFMPERADEVLRRAVREMLPPVKFRNAMMKRLIIR